MKSNARDLAKLLAKDDMEIVPATPGVRRSG
jgi:hypothetical protein